MPLPRLLAARARHMYRVVIVLVSFLMLGALMIGPDVFSYTKVYMEKEDDYNRTGQEKPDFRVYNESEKNWLISAMAIGTLIGMYPFNWLFSRYGARFVLFGAGLLSAVTSCLVPTCLDWSLTAGVLIRILQGISYAADFSVVGLVVSRWAPASETAIFLAILSSFTVVKSALQIPVADVMLEPYGWRSIYYAMAAIALAASFIWLCLYRDDPAESWASPAEVEHITQGKPLAHQRRIRPPYRKILTNVATHAMWVAAFIDTTTSIMLMIYTVTYLNKLGYTHTEAGYFTALSGYAFIIFKIIGGITSDRKWCCSERNKIRIYSFLSLVVPAALLAVLCLTSSNTVKVVLICAFQGFVGLNVGGFYKGGVLTSGPYAFFVLGQIQLFKSISVLVEPLLLNVLAPDDTLPEWHVYFYVHVGLMVVGFLVYAPLVRAEPAAYVTEAIEAEEEAGGYNGDGHREKENVEKL